MEYSSQPRQWLTWGQLTRYEQDCIKARHGEDQCREMMFLRCPTSRFILSRRLDDFRDYVVATGKELASCGVTGYASEHLWVIYHGEYEGQLWKRMLRKIGGQTGSVKQECSDLIVAYRNGEMTYRVFVEELVAIGPDPELLTKIRLRMRYKPGWEKHVLEQMAVAS